MMPEFGQFALLFREIKSFDVVDFPENTDRNYKFKLYSESSGTSVVVDIYEYVFAQSYIKLYEQ